MLPHYILLFSVIFTGFSSCSKILFLSQIPTRSHYILASKLVNEMAKKGHEVTFITPYPNTTQVKNINQIHVEGFESFYSPETARVSISKKEDGNPIQKAIDITHIHYLFTEFLISHDKIQNLLKSQQHFDVVILYYYFNDALLALAHHFKAPVVLFASMPLYVSESFLLSHPAPSSYVPNIILKHTGHMDFWQRLETSFYDICMILYYQWTILPKQQKLVENFIPGKPDLYKILNNESLILINSHVSVNEAVPMVPNAIEIGGFHIEDPKPLPYDLQKFLDDSPNGVIIFSMGSILRSVNFPEEKRKACVDTFAKLKLNVLWKFEENIVELPSNVKIMDWIPVSDVLAHPNVKIFLTHGGLLSTMEAVYHGVPLVGIPIMVDQKMNMALAVSNEYGIEVPYKELTENSLTQALDQVLNNPKYKKNIDRRSKIMRDRPLKPVDSALYWIEYVIRHQGAPHLRYPGADLNWFQRNLLDVVAFVILFSIFGTIIIVRLIVRNNVKHKTE
ncbi:UDP-glycosyltransferase UGT5-like [Zophobas morio]|uniref:UDP-glycosyltransferase UGT5-like n=1 Tax=Zophobas morio TaxID=2755281 RepID=UPI00308278F1